MRGVRGGFRDGVRVKRRVVDCEMGCWEMRRWKLGTRDGESRRDGRSGTGVGVGRVRRTG
jgi:hypothetical protein